MTEARGSTSRFPLIVAPFPGETFSSQEDFEAHERETAEVRKARWLYEQSLATDAARLDSQGSCGLCLSPTTFSSSTRHGEQIRSGLIPNWREQMECGCERALINRERALVHYLIASGHLRPWMRVGVSGQQARIANALSDFGVPIALTATRLQQIKGNPSHSTGAFDLLISVEEMTPELVSDPNVTQIVKALRPGGAFAFTASFLPDTGASPSPGASRTALGWQDLEAIKNLGFRRVMLTRYWSNEFGYLGPLNFLIAAVK